MAINIERLREINEYIAKYYIPEIEEPVFYDALPDFSFNKNRAGAANALWVAEPPASYNHSSELPLLASCEGIKDLDGLLHRLNETFSQQLLRMIRERNLNETDVYKKAYIDRRHFSKIKKDKNYTPNKKTVLAFAIALELTTDEAKDLLQSAGYALSRSSKFDVIIEYFLENKIYDMFEINDVLYEYEQPVFE